MEQSDLLRHVCTVCETLKLQYLVTGSQATTAFGKPRFTNNIAIAIDLKLNELDAFIQGSPPEDYYLSRDAVRAAIARRSMFNIIRPASRLKIDVIIPGTTEFEVN